MNSDVFMGIDPGPRKSAAVLYTGGGFHPAEIDNEMLLDATQSKCVNLYWLGFRSLPDQEWRWSELDVVLEGITPFSKLMYDLIDTLLFIGAVKYALPRRGAKLTILTRKHVATHLCGKASAGDAEVRSVLHHRFGPGTALAVGTKKRPGPLYGIKGKHLPAAMAVLLTRLDELHIQTCPELQAGG